MYSEVFYSLNEKIYYGKFRIVFILNMFMVDVFIFFFIVLEIFCFILVDIEVFLKCVILLLFFEFKIFILKFVVLYFLRLI